VIWMTNQSFLNKWVSINE